MVHVSRHWRFRMRDESGLDQQGCLAGGDRGFSFTFWSDVLQNRSAETGGDVQA